MTPNSGTNFIAINYNRVIETWWDSYKEYYYERRPENRKVDPGIRLNNYES